MTDILPSSSVPGGQHPPRQQLVLPHPDADQLTAFVELSLPEHERLETLAHLAQCSECRQIVALSLPSPESEPNLANEPQAEAAQAGPTNGRLLSWLPGLSAGWRPVWIAAPALAALLLLTLYLRKKPSDLRPAAKPAQVAGARPPAPPLRSIAPTHAAVPPPLNAPSAPPKAVAKLSVPSTVPQRPAANPSEAKPAASATTLGGRQSRPEARMTGRDLDSLKRESAPPRPPAAAPAKTSVAIVPNRSFAAKGISPAAATANGASVAGPLRKRAGVPPTPPSSTASPGPPGNGSRFLNQPAFSVRDAVSAANQTAPISPQPTGGIAASVTAQVAASTTIASGDPAETQVLDSAPIAVTDSKVPTAVADVPLTGRAYTPGQAPLPSGLAVLSLAVNQRLRIALDARNQLFISGGDGQHWRKVSAPWKGRAITVANILPATTRSVAPAKVLALAVPERYTPGAAATVQSGEAGAALTGTITDTTGAVIPDATVTATDNRTALTRTVRTDAQGHYLLDQLPPGVYGLDARAAGFTRQSQIAPLEAAQQSVNNIRLAVGQTAETVTVEVASSPQIEKSSGLSSFRAWKARRAASSSANKPVPPAAPSPLFLLTTDTGERWFSPDGIAWAR